MSRILVPTEVLIRVSDEAGRAAEELETAKNRLDQQIMWMMSSWEGTTRSRFFEDFQRAHGKMNKTIEHLRVTSQELKTIAFRFIQADMRMDLWNAASAAAGNAEPKNFWDHAGDFWEGLQTGAMSIANSVKDTATSLVEDPVGTVGDMAYNATIGTVEEIVDTAVWGGKMIFDADTREKFSGDVEDAGGTSNFIGQQAAMVLGGIATRRIGVKGGPHLKHDSGGDGGKGAEGAPQDNKNTLPKRTQEEIDGLGRDPAHGNQITEKGIIERDIGLDLEARGSLSGIKRDPSGAAEFIDSDGTKWDIKGFNSDFPPKKGGFRLDKALTQIEKEFDKGENVILDTTKMSRQHIEELRKAIEEKNMGDKILWWP